MWPFSTIKILTQRLEELKRYNEQLFGANQVLERELDKAQFNARNLQEKLFDLSGINKKEVVTQVQMPSSRQPIVPKSNHWQETKVLLEKKAAEDYWNKKNKEAEEKAQELNNIDKLEKEVFNNGN